MSKAGPPNPAAPAAQAPPAPPQPQAAKTQPPVPYKGKISLAKFLNKVQVQQVQAGLAPPGPIQGQRRMGALRNRLPQGQGLQTPQRLPAGPVAQMQSPFRQNQLGGGPLLQGQNPGPQPSPRVGQRNQRWRSRSMFAGQAPQMLTPNVSSSSISVQPHPATSLSSLDPKSSVFDYSGGKGKVRGLARRKGEWNPKHWGLSIDESLVDHPAFAGSSDTPYKRGEKKKGKK